MFTFAGMLGPPGDNGNTATPGPFTLNAGAANGAVAVHPTLLEAVGADAIYVETNGVPDADTPTVKTVCPGAAPDAQPGSTSADAPAVQGATAATMAAHPTHTILSHFRIMPAASVTASVRASARASPSASR